jgi:hypothetical protein
MKGLNKTEEYALYVSDAIKGLFMDEEERAPMPTLKIEEIDATKFFTGAIIACNLVFNQLTGQNKNYLELSHIANQLIVQEIMESKERGKSNE